MTNNINPAYGEGLTNTLCLMQRHISAMLMNGRSNEEVIEMLGEYCQSILDQRHCEEVERTIQEVMNS